MDAVADTDGGFRDIYARAGGITTLVSGDTDGMFDIEGPDISSDGTRACFATAESLDPTADMDGGKDDLYVRSGGVTSLVSGGGNGAFHVDECSISGDGTRVVFSTEESLDPLNDTDGTKARRLSVGRRPANACLAPGQWRL